MREEKGKDMQQKPLKLRKQEGEREMKAARMWRVALPGPKGESKREGADAEAETEAAAAAAAAAKARPKRSVRKVNEGKLHNHPLSPTLLFAPTESAYR